MSINLQKRTEKVGIVLTKRGILKAPIMKVGAAFDVSGSTQGLFRSGVIQDTFDRLLAVSLKFDDNGELDIWTFDTGHNQLQTATEKDEGSYIDKRIMNASKDINGQSLSKWGGTEYAGVLRDVMEFYYPKSVSVAAVAQAAVEKTTGFFSKLFGKKEEPVATPTQATPTTSAVEYPSFLMFITDGDNSDNSETLRVLDEISSKNLPIYIQLIGVGGGSSFHRLDQYAARYDNVGVVKLSSLSISDEKLYEELITQELVDWTKKVIK